MATGLNPALLRDMSLFRNLDREALAVIIRQARTRRVKRGERLFVQGRPAAACHALLHGRVRIAQQSAEGKTVTLRFVGPGEMFGVIGVFAGGRYLADAIAAADCVEIRWSASVMIDLMRRHPQIALNVIAVLGQRFAETQDRLREVITERVEQRIARTLLRLAKADMRGGAIVVRATQRDLGEMSGATHYTVSRALRSWQARGLVRSRRNEIELRDVTAIEKIAEDLSPPDADRAG
ncbi:MAG: Crp/Fnr family transcriptional regulator [Xanthobacteraceae bacterium]|nr:Crp/Fnr family transcriptional regulator [Xanthobacteraceae bacterium]